MTMNKPAWRAVPDPRAASRSHKHPGLRCSPGARGDPAGRDGAGLADLPNPVGALTAVPGALARPFPTKPSLPGATQLAVVPLRRTP